MRQGQHVHDHRVGHRGLVKDGTLTICTHLPYEPFEFTENGEVVGFDPDVLKIAADNEGLEDRGPRRRLGDDHVRARPSTPASATSAPAP